MTLAKTLTAGGANRSLLLLDQKQKPAVIHRTCQFILDGGELCVEDMLNRNYSTTLIEATCKDADRDQSLCIIDALQRGYSAGAARRGCAYP